MASSQRRPHHLAPKNTSQMDNVEVTAADAYLNTWITRYHDISFKCNGVYHGVVETIQSKGAATVVIGEKERGIPLGSNDNWCNKGVNFAKVLLLVDRLRPSINEPEYDKDTILRDKIKEGEVLFVVVEETKSNPENIYKYFASSAFKIEASGKFLDESVMLNIRDPLRGIVDSYVSQDVGVVRFGTYNGTIAKALFTSNSFKSSSGKMGGNSALRSMVPVHTMVYVEVTKWHGKTRTQEWEKLLHRDGILFKVTLAWLKDVPRPMRRGGEEEKVTETRKFVHEKRERCLKDSVENLPSLFGSKDKGDRKQNSMLTDIHAYYGVIEIIANSAVAVICTAHRKGEPLSWMDNWFTKGVDVERILLISDHVRVSKDSSECAKGTPMKSILREGDRVMVVVEPSIKGPDKCYKWFAKTCWKVTEDLERIPHIPLSLLPGHLRGEVESVIANDMGIVNFETHHGYVAKAFFSHGNFYKDGRTILTHVPLGSEIKKGTRVNLIVDKWHPGRNSKVVEQQIYKDGVNFRVIMAWEIGSSRPERSGFVGSKKGAKTDPQKMQKEFVRNEAVEMYSSSASEERQHTFGEVKTTGKERKQVVSNRGRKRGGRSYQKTDDSKSCSDSVDFDDNLSELADFLGATSVSTENLSIASSSHSDSNFPIIIPQKDRSFIEKHMNLKKNDNLMTGKTDALRYQNSSKYAKVTHSDGTKSGTLVSVDESSGVMQVDDDIHGFQSSAVYMYGLKLEDVPLHKLFHQGQTFKVHVEEGKITAVEYGTPQLPNLIRKAIAVYCENNSVSEDVEHRLECIMKCYGV